YGLLACISILITNNMRYYLPRAEKYFYVLIISAAVTGIWLWITKITLNFIFRHDISYINYQNNTLGIRFGISLFSFGCLTMISLLWYTQEEQKRMNEHTEEAKRMAKDAELYKLRQQLQPHFLFNSLN